MALKGTIKDFALPDIFQLIGIQKKTGILTLADGEESVTLKFLDGEVVGADTESMSLEDRLGQVLVRTSRITQEQLDQALRVQKNTLQRLGYILVSAGYLAEEDLVDALRIQSCQIIYRLFRWHAGDYHFEPIGDLEYDERHFTPISAETILMEGARMIDEWPIIERRIKNDKMVFRKTAAAAGLDLRRDPPPPPAEEIKFDLGFDFDQGPDGPAASNETAPADEAEIELSPDERQLLGQIDGNRTVGEICSVVSMGDFDAYRTLADLLTRNLIEEVPRGRAREAEREPSRGLDRVWLHAGRAGVLLVVLASLLTLRVNPFAPWRVLAGEGATDELRRYVSLSRLERIERAIEVFYLDAGTVPSRLEPLAHNGYLAPEDLIDPWGREYSFRVSPGGWRLAAADAGGGPDDLAVTRSFNPAQQLMLSDTLEEPPTATD